MLLTPRTQNYNTDHRYHTPLLKDRPLALLPAALQSADLPSEPYNCYLSENRMGSDDEELELRAHPDTLPDYQACCRRSA